MSPTPSSTTYPSGQGTAQEQVNRVAAEIKFLSSQTEQPPPHHPTTMEPGTAKSTWASGLEGGVGPSTDHTPSSRDHPEAQTWTTQARAPARAADPAPAGVYHGSDYTTTTSGNSGAAATNPNTTTSTDTDIDIGTTGAGAGPLPLDEAQEFFQQELSDISGSFPSREEVARRQAEGEGKPTSAAVAGDNPGVPLSKEQKQAAKEEARKLSAMAGLPKPGEF